MHQIQEVKREPLKHVDRCMAEVISESNPDTNTHPYTDTDTDTGAVTDTDPNPHVL